MRRGGQESGMSCLRLNSRSSRCLGPGFLLARLRVRAEPATRRPRKAGQVLVALASGLPLRKITCKDSHLKPKRKWAGLLVSAAESKKSGSESEAAGRPMSGFLSAGRRSSWEAQEHVGRDLHGRRVLGSGQAVASAVRWDSAGILESSENSPGHELGSERGLHSPLFHSDSFWMLWAE